MNCREWEERLALYAGGDLPAHEAVAVERHAAECPGCQVAVSGMKQALETLREAYAELPPEAAFGAVRAGVMATLRDERRPFWERPWLYALAAAASLAIAVGLFVNRPSIPAVPVAAIQPPQAALPATKGPELAPARREGGRRTQPVTHRPGRRSDAASGPLTPEAPVEASVPTVARPEAPRARETVVVRYTTDNPDVIILWIAESTGE